MAKLSLFAVAIAVALIGCGSEAAPAPSANEKEAISASAGSWNKESLDAFKKAHERAKSGADETAVAPGTPAGQKSK